MAKSAVIGALRVNLGLDSAQFQQGMKRAQKSSRGFSKKIRQGMVAAGAAATAALGGISLAIKGALNEADRMAKASQKFGVPVEELQRLRHAAELNGVAFQNLGNGMRRLSRNMADVMNGTGEAQEAFAELDVSVTGADGKLRSNSDVLNEVATKLAAMEDGALKTALAADIFGSRYGPELIPLLNQGAAGIEKLKAEADELGIVISGNSAKAAERFNDNLNRLGKVVSGFTTQIAGDLAPVLASITDGIVAVAKGFSSLPGPVRRMIAIVGGLTLVLVPAIAAFGVFALGLGAVSGPVLAVVGALGALTAAVLAFWPEIEAAWQAVKSGFSAVAEFVEQPLSDIVAQSKGFLVDRLNGVWERVKSGLEVVRGVFVSIFGEEIVSAFEQFHVQMFQTAVKLMTKLRDTIAGGFEWIGDKVTSALGTLREKWDGFYNWLVGRSLVPDLVEEVLAWFGRLGEGMRGETETATDDVADKFRDMNDRIRDDLAAGGGGLAEAVDSDFRAVAEAITGPFQQALEKGRLSFSFFAKGLMSSADSLADRIIDDSFSKINEALGRLFEGKGFSLSQSSSTGGFASLFTSIASGIGSFIGGFHQGTSFTVGGRGGIDNNLLSMAVSRGEQVDITPANERGRRDGPTFGAVTFNFPNVRDRDTAREAGGSARRELARMARRGGDYL